MKLLIEVPSNYKLLVSSTPNSGALLQALTEAKLVSESGYGKDKKYTFANKDTRIEVDVVADDFDAQENDVLATLRSEKEQSDSRWIQYYNKANAAEKELAEIKKDLDSRGISYTKQPTQ